MKQLLCIILAICMLHIPGTASAGIRVIENPDNPRKNIFIIDYPEQITFSFIYGENIEEAENRPMPSIKMDGEQLKGEYSYPNYNGTELGPFELQWVFTPDDKSIEPITGTVKAIIMLRTSGTIRDEDDDSAPELLSDNITMQVGTSYTPQIINNAPDSEYIWKSSDKSIVTVNKKTGKLKALKAGTSVITCHMTTPYDEEYTLRMEVSVQTLVKASSDLHLDKGEKFTLPSKYDKSEYTVFYKSSKDSVAYVDQYTGEIIARKTGQAYITRTIIDKDFNIKIERFDITVTSKQK